MNFITDHNLCTGFPELVLNLPLIEQFGHQTLYIALEQHNIWRVQIQVQCTWILSASARDGEKEKVV